MKNRKPSRLTISLTDPERAWITAMAEQWGLSLAETIRRVIDERMTKGGKAA